MPRPKSSMLNYLIQIKAQQKYLLLSLRSCQIHYSLFLSLHPHPHLSISLSVCLCCRCQGLQWAKLHLQNSKVCAVADRQFLLKKKKKEKKERIALSVSQLKRFCFYMPNPVVVVVVSQCHHCFVLMFTVCVCRLPRSISHSFECKIT